MKRIYLDYAASTPVNISVLKTMELYFVNKFGNPNSIHYFGQEALKGVEWAKEKIAQAINANSQQILFTSGATEANNWALIGPLKKFISHYPSLKIKPKIIISAFEHESILETANELKKNNNVQVEILKIHKNGFVDLAHLKSLLDENTILVSIMYANNEIGSIQPIKKIAQLIKDFKESKKSLKEYPLFHTDAVQALQFLNCNVSELEVDLMSLSAQKIYGPKGVGCLYVKDINLISPIIFGGLSENELRGGTINSPAIVGFGKAVELVLKNQKSETERLKKLRDYLFKNIKKIYPAAQLNGIFENRLPNNLNIYFPDWCANDLLVKLDLEGLSVSAGSACTARIAQPSHVILALGYSKDRASSSLRITLGRPTTSREISESIKIFKSVLNS